MLNSIRKVIELFLISSSIKPYFFWPVFSLASYSVVLRARRSGVLPHTVIDVGANIGQFSICAQRLFSCSAIYAIEANEELFSTLSNNLNKFNKSNNIIYNVAISSYSGNVEFKINNDSQVSSILDLGSDRKEFYPNSNVISFKSIKCTTLDSLFLNKKLTGPILLKIDVQGAEHLVIEGASELLSKINWIILEISFKNLYEGEKSFEFILNLLSTYGFTFSKPLNVHYSPKTYEIMEMDALFTKN